MFYSYIVIHHSLTRDGETVSWNAIRRYHLRRGWVDIGYNFGIEQVEEEYLCMVGRPLGEPGAHCRNNGMNRRGIGICCVGNYDEERPPMPMLDEMVHRLIKPLMEIFDIPENRILFHRELASYKSCPGKLFRKESILGLL